LLFTFLTTLLFPAQDIIKAAVKIM